MKKITLFLCIAMMGPSAWAADKWNPFMGYNDNQIAVNIGQGIDSGFLVPPPSRFVPFFMLPHIQYSQPTTFFKLPARQSLNFGETVGMGKRYGWKWNEYSIPMLFASGDAALLYGENWYYATGVGVGFQAKQNKRVGSKLLFQFKISAGYRFNDCWGAEVFMQHFSNGNTAPDNHSYAFYGLGTTYSF